MREDRTHDEMLRALQRLLREKELTFDEYDLDIGELKSFCGIVEGESLYFGPPEGTDAQEDDEDGQDDDEDGQDEDEDEFAPRARRSSKKGKAKQRGKDLLQRLMEKGLMPLSALDVIRGWMVLEMSTSSEEERRIVKAATRNRLGYHEVRQALLAMYEDRGGKGSTRTFGGNKAYWGEMSEDDFDDGPGYQDAAYVNYQSAETDGWWCNPGPWAYYQDGGYEEEEWPPEEEDEPNEVPNDEVFASLQGEQRENEAEADFDLHEQGQAKGPGLRQRKEGRQVCRGSALGRSQGQEGLQGQFSKARFQAWNQECEGPRQLGKLPPLHRAGPRDLLHSERDAKTEGKEMMGSEGLVDTGATASLEGRRLWSGCVRQW